MGQGIISFLSKYSHYYIIVSNGIDSLIKMTAKSTMKAQKYQVMPSNRSAAEYNLSRNIKDWSKSDLYLHLQLSEIDIATF